MFDEITNRARAISYGVVLYTIPDVRELGQIWMCYYALWQMLSLLLLMLNKILCDSTLFCFHSRKVSCTMTFRFKNLSMLFGKCCFIHDLRAFFLKRCKIVLLSLAPIDRCLGKRDFIIVGFLGQPFTSWTVWCAGRWRL